MIARSITKHSSFFIMMGTSGAIFLANLIARKNLPTDSYEYFSYIITIATILSSFSLLGTEQLIIRFSIKKDKEIEISKNILKTIFTSLTISAIASPVVANLIFKSNISETAVFSTTLAIGLSLIAYNLQRLQEKFSTSQLFQGAWRIALLLVVIYSSYGTPSLDIEQTTTFAMLSIAVASIAKIVYDLKKITISNSLENTASTALAFSFSLALMTILGGFDRVLAENTGNPGVFSNFVHLSMFLIFPFNILSSYIGLKEGIYFKKEFSKKILLKKIIRATAISTTAYAAVATTTYAFKDELDLYVTSEVIIACLLLTTTKTIYSLASSAMGATGTPRSIWLSNIISGAIIITTYTLSMLNAASLSIEGIIWMFSTLWITRTIIFMAFIGGKHATI